jgi:nitrogen fixation NifU-like protein
MPEAQSLYSDKVMDHFRNPRNTGDMENPDGIGHVGNPVCGDIMELVYGIRKLMAPATIE